VLQNKGPAVAREVSLTVRDAHGRILVLLDLQPNEFPLSVLDVNANYPIPFAYKLSLRHACRFEATLSWSDDDGLHERRVPLRRGQLPD